MKHIKIKSTNITWYDNIIPSEDREKVNGHKAAVIWLTGLPGAGKSTIAVTLNNSKNI